MPPTGPCFTDLGNDNTIPRNAVDGVCGRMTVGIRPYFMDLNCLKI